MVFHAHAKRIPEGWKGGTSGQDRAGGLLPLASGSQDGSSCAPCLTHNDNGEGWKQSLWGCGSYGARGTAKHQDRHATAGSEAPVPPSWTPHQRIKGRMVMFKTFHAPGCRRRKVYCAACRPGVWCLGSIVACGSTTTWHEPQAHCSMYTVAYHFL